MAVGMKGKEVLYTNGSTGEEVPQILRAVMGREEEEPAGIKTYHSEIKGTLPDRAETDSLILQDCRPAHQGKEITDEMIEDRRSIVFDEAGKRLHVQKALSAPVD